METSGVQATEISPYSYSHLIFYNTVKDILETKTLQLLLLGKLDAHVQKNDTRAIPAMLYKSHSE